MPGCYCNATNAPCSWCTELSQDEADTLDTYGMELLVWLQKNSFFLNGKFQYETEPHLGQLRWIEFQSAIRIAQEALGSRQKTRASQANAMHKALLGIIAIADECKAELKRARESHNAEIINLKPNLKRTRLPLSSAVIDLSLYNHRRKP